METSQDQPHTKDLLQVLQAKAYDLELYWYEQLGGSSINARI
jgi:hypothetical protein